MLDQNRGFSHKLFSLYKQITFGYSTVLNQTDYPEITLGTLQTQGSSPKGSKVNLLFDREGGLTVVFRGKGTRESHRLVPYLNSGHGLVGSQFRDTQGNFRPWGCFLDPLHDRPKETGSTPGLDEWSRYLRCPLQVKELDLLGTSRLRSRLVSYFTLVVGPVKRVPFLVPLSLFGRLTSVVRWVRPPSLKCTLLHTPGGPRLVHELCTVITLSTTK